MKVTHHQPSRGYKGYHPAPFFWTNPRARHFFNLHLLLVVALVGAGVWLLTWALIVAQNAS